MAIETVRFTIFSMVYISIVMQTFTGGWFGSLGAVMHGSRLRKQLEAHMSTVMKPKLSHIHRNTGQFASDLGSIPEHVSSVKQTSVGWWWVWALYYPIYSGFWYSNRGLPNINQQVFHGMREGFGFHCSCGETWWNCHSQEANRKNAIQVPDSFRQFVFCSGFFWASGVFLHFSHLLARSSPFLWIQAHDRNLRCLTAAQR